MFAWTIQLFFKFQGIPLNAVHSSPKQQNAFLKNKSDLHQNYLDSLQCLRNFVLQESDTLACVIDSILTKAVTQDSPKD